MAINRGKANVGYGLTNALQNLSPQPIVSERAPTTHDFAELGTLWVNKATNAYYIATSTTAGATNWEAQSTGAGTFAAVTVTGAVGTTLDVVADTNLGGTLDVGGNTAITGNLAVTGDVTITGDFDITDVNSVSITSTNNAANAIYLHANGGATETIGIHSDQGTGVNSIDIYSDLGGILLEATGKATVDAINLVADVGGVKFDAALHSQFTVVGAAQDLDLTSIGGSITLAATEAANDAVLITASDAAGKVALVGVGGITMATTNAAIGVTTGTGAINLGTDAVAKTITVGNATGATNVVVEAGTAGAGAIKIGQSAHAVPITVGNVTGNTGVTINSGTAGIALASTGAGDITLNSSDTCLIDAAGVLELNSSAGVISIGNDAVSQNMNIGTAGVRILQVGSSTGASGIAVHSGTAGCTFGTDANAHATIIGSTTAACTLTLDTPAGTPVVATNGLSVTTATAGITLPGPVNIITGAGAPANGLALHTGDVYINTTAATAATRMYIATGVGAWTYIPANA